MTTLEDAMKESGVCPCLQVPWVGQMSMLVDSGVGHRWVATGDSISQFFVKFQTKYNLLLIHALLSFVENSVRLTSLQKCFVLVRLIGLESGFGSFYKQIFHLHAFQQDQGHEGCTHPFCYYTRMFVHDVGHLYPWPLPTASL